MIASIKALKSQWSNMNIQHNQGDRAMLTRLIKTFLVIAVAIASHSLLATEIEDISFSVMPGDRVQVRVKMDSPPPKFKEVTTENPARIWMDFDGVGSALKQKTHSIGVGVTRSVTAVEAGGKTRLVFNLVEMTPYKTEVSGNELILTIGHSQSGASSSSSSAVATDNSSMNSVSNGDSVASLSSSAPSFSRNDISDIDFRRGEQGEARIVIQLNSSKVGVDLRQEGRVVMADFVGANISNNLIRKLDVVDFGTPAKLISTSTVGDNVRVTIDTLDDFEYLAYQADDSYVIELKPLTPEEVEQKKLSQPVYTGERLSLNFQDIPVRAVLSIVAEVTGLNLVASDTVSGSITLRLQNVPWDQALDIVLKTKGLDKRVNGNVMLVAPAQEIAARESLELESTKQREELAPLRSEFIQVNYAKADSLAALIQTAGANYISSRGSIAVDERTNHLLVQDTAAKLEQIRLMVKKLDVPVTQVLIESRIVVASSDFKEELGVKFGVSKVNTGGAISGDMSGANSMFYNNAPANRTFAVDLPVANATGSIGMTIARLSQGTILDVELSALESEDEGEIIASPRVITANQKEAYIESGQEIPYQEASSAGNVSISFKKAVLSLKVTPQITPDDRIILDLTVTQDSRGEATLVGPAIDTREVTTQVLVENGGTIVLGGVFERESKRVVKKVPFFGDIPGIGALFRHTSEISKKQELLIFVTPKIVKESIR